MSHYRQHADIQSIERRAQSGADFLLAIVIGFALACALLF